MTEDSSHPTELGVRNTEERRTLAAVLGINLAQALVVGVVGFAAESAGLVGAALDNLADAGVYAVSLYAVGRSIAAKARIARLSGILLLVLGAGMLAEVVRRFFVPFQPIGIAMMITASANAATNFVCLRLLREHRGDGVHLKASWIFTSNDMLANAGVVLSGAAVMLFGSPVPDLVIGLVVVGIAVKSGVEILEQARLGGPSAGH